MSIGSVHDRNAVSNIGCLHDPANVQQLAGAFWIHLVEVCWTCAGSCKHPNTRPTKEDWAIGSYCSSCVRPGATGYVHVTK